MSPARLIGEYSYLIVGQWTNGVGYRVVFVRVQGVWATSLVQEIELWCCHCLHFFLQQEYIYIAITASTHLVTYTAFLLVSLFETLHTRFWSASWSVRRRKLDNQSLRKSGATRLDST